MPTLWDMQRTPAGCRVTCSKCQLVSSFLPFQGCWLTVQGLVDRGLHPAFAALEQDCPLQDRSLLRRLSRVLSALAHWAPIFGEVGFLPAASFPFVKLFGADEETCFEVRAQGSPRVHSGLPQCFSTESGSARAWTSFSLIDGFVRAFLDMSGPLLIHCRLQSCWPLASMAHTSSSCRSWRP